MWFSRITSHLTRNPRVARAQNGEARGGGEAEHANEALDHAGQADQLGMPSTAAVFRRLAGEHRRGEDASARAQRCVPPTAPVSTVADYVLAKDVERLGKAFYATCVRTFRADGTNARINAATVAEQLAELAAVGRPQDADDGSAIEHASDGFQRALTAMTRDAAWLAALYTEVAAGHTAVRGDLSLEPVVNSFTDVLVEAAKAGYEPEWCESTRLTAQARLTA